MNNPCDQICKKQLAYEKAIDAYQFHVQRYHTWVNYYAIFVGALFVALYTIMSGMFNNIENCSTIKNIEISNNYKSIFFLFLISYLGLWTTICWLASTVGHYAWMKSWMSIVKKLEADCLGTNYWVYRYAMKNNEVINSKRLKCFISTQKITQSFLIALIIAWNIVIIKIVMQEDWKSIAYSISIIISLLAIIMIYKGKNKLYSSTLIS